MRLFFINAIWVSGDATRLFDGRNGGISADWLEAELVGGLGGRTGGGKTNQHRRILLAKVLTTQVEFSDILDLVEERTPTQAMIDPRCGRVDYQTAS